MNKIPQEHEKSKQNCNNALYELLRADGSITINKALIHSIGLHEAILFAELISRQDYFYLRNQLTEEGYFFNTVDDLQAATCLSGKQQKKAISNLEELGLLKTSLEGMPARRHFKIIFDDDLLAGFIIAGKEKMRSLKVFKNSEKPYKSSTAKSAELDPPKVPTNNTNVNDTKRESTPQPEKPPAPTTETENEKDEFKKTMDHLATAYREKFDQDYPFVKGQDHGIIKNLINEHGAAMVREIITMHVNTRDPWILSKGCSVKTIGNSLPEYLTVIKKEEADERAKREQRERWDREQTASIKRQAEIESMPEHEKIRLRIEDRQKFIEVWENIAGDEAKLKVSKIKAEIQTLEERLNELKITA